MSEKRRDNKGRLLRTGESQRKDGAYMFRYIDHNGERQTVYSWRLVETDKLPPGKRACAPLREIEKQIQRDKDDGIKTADANSLTVNALFETFLEMRRYKTTTKMNYRHLYDSHVRDVLGHKTLNTIKYSNIQKLYADMIGTAGLKFSTVQGVNSILGQMFAIAVKDNIIRLNPVDGVAQEVKKMFDIQATKRHALTEMEQERLIYYVYHAKTYQRWATLITVLLGTGMRIGEALGLTWNDCDFKKGVIYVSHALLYKEDEEGKYEYRISATKTPAGMRMIPMFSEVRKALLTIQAEKRAVGHEPFVVDGYTDFIFLNNNGKVFTPATVYDALQNIMTACNREEFFKAASEKREPCYLPKFSAHILRHTFCTRLCEVESNLKIVQDIMGHKSFRTTMDVYNEATTVKKVASFKEHEGKIKLA